MTLVGRPVPRLEDRRFLTGNGSYLPNREFKNAAHVAFVRSDIAHARINHIVLDGALALPGVIAIVTAADLGFEPVMPDQAGLGVYPLS